MLMQIKRLIKTQSQTDSLNRIKNELLILIQERIVSLNKLKRSTNDLKDLFEELDAVSEGFDISSTITPYEKVDRCGSMLSGPFFVSGEFPIPIVDSKEMYPLVQFDLSVLSEALRVEVGSGLLQLWYDKTSKQELIQIIPKEAMISEDLIEYKISPLNPNDSFPLPSWVELDPVTHGVHVINGLVSRGIENQNSDFVNCYYSVFENKDDLLWKLLKDFEKIECKQSGGSLSVGGTLHVIQYNHTDVKMRQLIKFADWGSSGSAEIFFHSKTGQSTKYSFWSCVR